MTPMLPPRLLLALLTMISLPLRAAVFTNDTRIAFNDTSYDGDAIVVTNCELVVDGVHSFESLQVQNGGLLTHSYAPEGFPELLQVTNELQVLTATNFVLMTKGGHVVLSGVLVSFQGTVYTNGIDYTATNYSQQTQLQRTSNSAIPDGAMVRVDYDYTNFVPAGLMVSLAGDLLVARNAAIRANGTGYRWGAGPGRGYSSLPPAVVGAGAGHGGAGGLCASNATPGATYDSTEQPDQMGSSGGDGVNGPGGYGGGLISIVAGGVIQLEGDISANGLSATNARAGGGSGGGIFIAGAALRGGGSITANGGAGEPLLGGGGGGGRIALQCATNLFVGSVSAYGGKGFQYGGAGTIFVSKASSTNGTVTVDNGDHRGAPTGISSTGRQDLALTGAAVLVVTNSLTVSNLFVNSNCWITALPAPDNAVWLSLTVRGDALFMPGGGIDLDGLGYAYNDGPGLAVSTLQGRSPAAAAVVTPGMAETACLHTREPAAP